MARTLPWARGARLPSNPGHHSWVGCSGIADERSFAAQRSEECALFQERTPPPRAAFCAFSGSVSGVGDAAQEKSPGAAPSSATPGASTRRAERVSSRNHLEVDRVAEAPAMGRGRIVHQELAVEIEALGLAEREGRGHVLAPRPRGARRAAEVGQDRDRATSPWLHE